MKRFISFSGGVESTTMCLLYGKGATAIVADTGNEEPEMYERLDWVESRLKEIHNGDFTLLRLYPIVIAKGVTCHSLLEVADVWKFFPSRQHRWCTGKLKIEPIDDFLSGQGECELMIGFNFDENPGDDRTGSFMKCKNVQYSYPLHEDGYTREECIEMLKEYDLQPNFPPYMKRGGCRTCFFRSRKEAKAKYFINRKGFLEDMDFEIKIQDSRKKFYGINMNFPDGYASVMRECEQEIALFGLEEMKSQYRHTEPHKPCGAFCHR